MIAEVPDERGPRASAPADRPIHVHALIDRLGFGGAEVVLAELAAAIPAQNVRMTVGYLSGVGDASARRMREVGIEPIHVPTSSLVGRRDRARVRAHVAEVAPDVVHTHLDYADVHGGLAARSLGIPAVSTWHMASVLPGLRSRVVTGASAFVRARACARVITVSEAAHRSYVDRWRIDPDRVVTLHNAIGRAPEPGEGARLRAEIGVPADAVVLMTLGLLRPEKGQVVAAQAMRRIRERIPGACLVVVGDGVQRPAIEAVRDELGHDAIRLVGERSDVMRCLDAADVLVQPSHTEALPTSIIEAFAASLPVVATDVGGIPELVDDTVGALVAAPPDPERFAETLVGVLSDREGLARRGRAARARYLEAFTAERWAAATRRLYDDALATTAPGAHGR